MMINKENLLNFMVKGHVHLSKKDYGFFSNLIKIIEERKQVTTNQSKLFDKLILKYQRQLKKCNFDLYELQKLNWQVELVDTKQEYLIAILSIEDNQLHFKSPFNTQFLNSFKRIENNTMVWDRNRKVYIGPFYTHLIKKITVLAEKHFGKIHYCPVLQQLVNDVMSYNDLIFEPTLVESNGNFYIGACNESLSNAIKDIKLESSPKILNMLSQFGITISEKITNKSNFLQFAGQYLVKDDVVNIDQIIKWLKLLDIEHVYTHRDFIYNKQTSAELAKACATNGITTGKYSQDELNKRAVLIETNDSYYQISYNKILKVIHLTNSKPIAIA
jgi:hypothetical protein